ncbi:hypothetical protein QBE52_05265 [Clostridiaceae bacterium 35-E11]
MHKMQHPPISIPIDEETSSIPVAEGFSNVSIQSNAPHKEIFPGFGFGGLGIFFWIIVLFFLFGGGLFGFGLGTNSRH